MTGQLVRLNGTELFVERGPSCPGLPIVFLHGFGLDARMWEPQWAAWETAFPLFRYDLRGFGRSALPGSEPYAHEDDLAALLEWAGAAQAHVIGLSFGGRVALRFAAAYPERVKSLTLADPALDGHAWSTAWQERWKVLMALAKAGRIADARQAWLEHPLFASARRQPLLAAHLAEMINAYSGWHWHRPDPMRVESPPLAERLASIRIPTLVVWGKNDLSDFQTIAARLVRELPRAQAVPLEGTGHMSNLEAPAAFTRAVEAFIRTQAPK